MIKEKLNPTERIILENISKQYQWIARDEDGDLYIYENKPQKKYISRWYSSDGFSRFCGFSAFNHLFQTVQWSDSAPTLIADLLKEK